LRVPSFVPYTTLFRSRVPGVIEVHEDRVKFAGLDGVDGLGRGGHSLRLVALRLEQQTKGVADVRLIIGQKHSIRLRGGSLHSDVYVEFILVFLSLEFGQPETRHSRS